LSNTEPLRTERLTETVGAEVLDVDVDRLRGDADLPQLVMQALEEHGVLVFRALYIDDETQVEFCRKLGEVVSYPGEPIPEILVVSLDPEHPYGPHFKAAEAWHMDDYPKKVLSKATMLSAKVISSEGGETEFASTYAAYGDLSDEDKERLSMLSVVHSAVPIQMLIYPEPTDEQLGFWRAQTQEHPLVWSHPDGRKSLILGKSADYVVGMDPSEGHALMDRLLERATRAGRVYTHLWSDGDTIMWNNPGVVHQRLPYEPGTHRRLHRTTIAGKPDQ
jgi:alpha-ketoglutarate-dependent taurine dioxygenase